MHSTGKVGGLKSGDTWLFIRVNDDKRSNK